MDPQTRTASSEGDTRGGPPPPEEPQRAELSVVEPGPEPTAAALPVSSALDARFLALGGTLGELVSLHEIGRGCVYASAVTRSLLGADPSDLVGRDWAELVPPEDDNPFAAGAARRRGPPQPRPPPPPPRAGPARPPPGGGGGGG